MTLVVRIGVARAVVRSLVDGVLDTHVFGAFSCVACGGVCFVSPAHFVIFKTKHMIIVRQQWMVAAIVELPQRGKRKAEVVGAAHGPVVERRSRTGKSVYASLFSGFLLFSLHALFL